MCIRDRNYRRDAPREARINADVFLDWDATLEHEQGCEGDPAFHLFVEAPDPDDDDYNESPKKRLQVKKDVFFSLMEERLGKPRLHGTEDGRVYARSYR